MSTMAYIKVAEPLVGEEEAQAVREVLLSGMYVSGRRVREFEEAFADFVGVKRAIAVSSGTAALQLALAAMGIGQGDEVIVPSLSFFATASAVLHAGAKPVFADIDDDYCLDPDSTEGQVTASTKAIIPVHYLGHAARMDALCGIAEKHGLSIIEDCAQSIGTRHRGWVTGSIGRAGAFSFFATKNMTTGEGGMVTTDDDEVAEKARLMRSHGMTGRDDHVILGYNYRMTEMEAAVGAIQLRKLPELNRIRRENSHYLLERIGDLPWIRVQSVPEHIEHTFFWCPLFVREEVLGMSTLELRSRLHEAGIGTRHRYLKPLYSQPMLREDSPYPRAYDITCPFNGEETRYQDLYFPNAEKYAGRLLGLPNHPGLRQDQLDYIVQTVRSIG